MAEGVDLAALQAWMDTRRLGQGPIEDAIALSGGTQNILLRFARGADVYVLRRPPLNLRPNSNETMRREARVLAAIAGSVVPHPRLIADGTQTDIIGAAFYLMAPVEGFNPHGGLPSPHADHAALRHRIGLSMVEAVASLGVIDYEAVGLTDFGKPDGYLERQVERWRSQLASYAEYPGWPGAGKLPGVGEVARWLDRHRPATFAPGIIHGDFHLANVMVRHDSGDIAALVDWELSTIGDPLLDLGWLIATWPDPDHPRASDIIVQPWNGFATTAELTAHYARMSGRDLSAIGWYVVLACYKLGIILEGTHARACAGKAPQETGMRLHTHAVDLFERALRHMH